MDIRTWARSARYWSTIILEHLVESDVYGALDDVLFSPLFVFDGFCECVPDENFNDLLTYYSPFSSMEPLMTSVDRLFDLSYICGFVLPVDN